MIKTITTHIEVDTKIVRLLSKSTYQRSFSSAIRELVSNAYDADALSVKINISEDYQKIEIIDDGNGMTFSEFQKYLTIAGNKSKKELTRKYSRNRIGQFGIGFLSIFPFCDELEISTTSENSTELLSTIIPAKEYMDTGKELNVSDIPILVKIAEKKAELKSHYTRMRLINPSYLVKNYFDVIETKKRDSIYAWNPFRRFIWELKEDLPIKYETNGNTEQFLEYEEPIGINVFVNDRELYRNKLPQIVLQEYEGKLNDIFFKFSYNSNYQSIKPFEARGIKVRVNNVGVGKRTDFGLKRDRGFSRLHWIAGELQIESKVKSFLSINRDEFVSSPSVDEIIEFCAENLRKAAYFVETVDIAEKSIINSFEETINDKVESKIKTISSNIKTLEKRGFEIVEDSSMNELVSIDKSSKTIYVNKSLDKIEIEVEKINIIGKNYEITYSHDDYDEMTPCVLLDNKIIINTKFPLFKSKTYGNVFKKMILILLMRSKENLIDSATYDRIIKDYIKEFKEFV